MEGKLNTKSFLRQNAIWLVFVFEVIFFAIFSKGTFVTPGNITNILRQVSYYGIASVGMTFVILIGGIDLSIGSIITLVNMVCAYMIVNMSCHWTIAVLASLVIGVVIGVLNGLMISKIGIPALIATFAAQTVFEGLAYILTAGMPISGFNKTYPEFNFFARWTVSVKRSQAVCFFSDCKSLTLSRWMSGCVVPQRHSTAKALTRNQPSDPTPGLRSSTCSTTPESIKSRENKIQQTDPSKKIQGFVCCFFGQI